MTVSVQGPKRRGLMIGDEQVGHALGQGWIWIDLTRFLQDLQSEVKKEQMVKSY